MTNSNQASQQVIWTDDAVAECTTRNGYRLETARETAKWIDFYREYDHLVSEDHGSAR